MNNSIKQSVLFQLTHESEDQFVVSSVQVVSGQPEGNTSSLSLTKSTNRHESSTQVEKLIATEYRNKLQIKISKLEKSNIYFANLPKEQCRVQVARTAKKFWDAIQAVNLDEFISQLPEFEFKHSSSHDVYILENYKLSGGSRLAITQISNRDDPSTGVHVYEVSDTLTGTRHLVGYNLFKTTNLAGPAGGINVSSLTINILPPYRSSSIRHPNVNFFAHELFEISQVLILSQFRSVIFVVDEVTAINRPIAGNRSNSMAFYLKRGFYPMSPVEASDNSDVLLAKITSGVRITDKDCIDSLCTSYKNVSNPKKLLWIFPVIPLIELNDQAEIVKPFQIELAIRFALSNC